MLCFLSRRPAKQFSDYLTCFEKLQDKRPCGTEPWFNENKAFYTIQKCFKRQKKPCEFPGVEFLKDCSSEKEVCLDAFKFVYEMSHRVVMEMRCTKNYD